MRRFLIDTNVFVYALGAEHRYRQPCRDVLERQAQGDLAGELTTIVVAEVVHQRRRQTGDRREASRRGRELATAFRVHAIDVADVELGLRLYERADGLDVFDALLAAAAVNRGIDAIVSADRAFQEVTEIAAVDPLDAAALRQLGQEPHRS